MASIFGHGAVAIALGVYQPRVWWTPRFWLFSLGCAILPDLDVVGFVLGIPYDHPLGHRGVSHSLLFAGMVGITVVACAFPSLPRWTADWWRLVLHFSAVTASHGVLDAMTDGGLGVAFFAPFDHTRYFFAWRPIRVSPIGIVPFFSWKGIMVVISEAVWIGALVGLLAIGRVLVQRARVAIIPADRD